jgi:hypothetical protein
LREFLLGDGISYMPSDANGDIWTGYFDEREFGNYGWTTPVGAAGVPVSLSQAKRFGTMRHLRAFAMR